jgi:hypothetical protein
MLKKGIIVGVIFLLVLVSVPLVSGEHILYPKEEGPYTVTALGPSNGGGGRFFTLFHLLPLWFLLYPLDVNWDFNPGSVFFVNGEKQEIVYPAQIGLYGFKGYGQTVLMLALKWRAAGFIRSLTGVLPTTRARVIGLCNEIIVDDSR